MPLLIQDYLRSGGTLEDLASTRLVKARRHGRYDNLVLLKYGIEADFHDPLVRECRGLILDESDDWHVVSRSFDKFGNDGESYVPAIDWSTARVQEKLDGSLCVLYHYDGAWHVQTSGSPDASGEVERAGEKRGMGPAAGKTFETYFWEAFEAEGGELPGYPMNEYGQLCFAFELMGPLNRVVVVHEKPSLRLIGVRDRQTGRQYRLAGFETLLDIEAVREFRLSSLAEIRASFDHISPVSQEGYVVVDAAFNRVKIKHPGYVALHHAKDGLGPRAFVEIARSGEVPEVVTAFPEYAPLLESARGRYVALVARTEAAYASIGGIESQKEFAAEALKLPFSAALFKMRSGRVTAADFYRSVSVDKLIDWMGADEAEAAGRAVTRG